MLKIPTAQEWFWSV